MRKIKSEESSYAKRTTYFFGDYHVQFTKLNPSYRKLNFALKITGMVVMYGAGMLSGKVIDNIPYLNELIPQTIDFVCGINVQNNIDSLGGLVGGLVGLIESGVKLHEDTLQPDKFVIAPMYARRLRTNSETEMFS